MPLKFASLGSGSSGNATIVSNGQMHILVDCGFSMKETQKRLARLDLSLQDLSAILVTHEHSDHVKGVSVLARKLLIPVYMTTGTFLSRSHGDMPGLVLIHGHEPFSIGEVEVRPVPVPHDAREPTQFIFSFRNRRLGVLTDLGSITPTVIEAYDGCDALLVEANHDPTMLATGPYPPSLKARVAGAWGHLSNAQTASFLSEIDVSKLQHLVVGHISQKNNCVDVAKACLFETTRDLESVHFACQEEGFDWLSLI